MDVSPELPVKGCSKLEQLPPELLLEIFKFLEPAEITKVQLVSRQLETVGRDEELWKLICFEHSRAEAERKRRDIVSRLIPLRSAMEGIFLPQGAPSSNSSGGGAGNQSSSERLKRARANWDPTWPGEKPNYYQEYIHRHGPLSIDWLPVPEKANDTSQFYEALGLGVLARDNGVAERAISPLEDGNVCVWDIAPDRHRGGRRRLVAHTLSPLLPNTSSLRHSLLTETGAVDNVSIDSTQLNAYFANHDTLTQVDLSTLQVVQHRKFPFTITSLSAATHPTPLTIGTTHTLHLHDPRSPPASPGSPFVVELIGGTYPHATLSQPGPLSVQHLSTPQSPESIWVAGRFTSLLHYDRRVFPRLSSTLFSGARISSLVALPYAYLPRDLNVARDASLSDVDLAAAKALPGHTLLAAGEYRGKGSLELYGLSQAGHRTALLPPRVREMSERDQCFRNRQTLSKTRLLSVAPHGQRYVFSDGDGNVKWVERDGFTTVRECNINDLGGVARPEQHMFGAEENEGDIVQKIVPTHGSAGKEAEVNRDDLLLWTGEGRVGLLGFQGKRDGGRVGWDGSEDAEEGLDGEARAHEERMYGVQMRRALERQADEVRFIRAMGI